MPRKPIILTDEHPYHVTGRSNNRDWFDLPLENCFDVFVNIIAKVIEKYEFKFHAFVLMDNHFHMIVSTPKSNLSGGMRYFMTETARGIRVRSLRVNHVYGGRYRASLITSSIYYANVIKYVYRNPVRANLVTFVEDYQWSSISNNNSGLRELVTPIETFHEDYLPQEKIQQLTWYNECFQKNTDDRIRKALRKSTFEIKPDRNTRKKIELDIPS